ncbi:hypothetical protein ACN47E_003986 [Coniothyrium glycines]
MVKTKVSMISGPMNAKHVGGVSVITDAGIDSYFRPAALEPDEVLSHTFAAPGKIEALRRADTVASSIRRPSVALTRSISKIRGTDFLYHLEDQHDSRMDQDCPILTSNAAGARPLRMQSSLSRLRQRVGLDRELHEPDRKGSPEPEFAPHPPDRSHQRLNVRRSFARLATTSSVHSTAAVFEDARSSIFMEPNDDESRHQQPTIRRKPTIVQQQSLLSKRHPSPRPRLGPAPAVSYGQDHSNPPRRPHRADSGTAIDFRNVPIDEQPLGFKEITAVRSFGDRMALYKKTREYWAHADHGLIDWTKSAIGPRAVSTTTNYRYSP